MWKRGEIFSSFPHYFIYIFLTSGVKLHIHLLNVVVQFIVFLTLSTLICRSTDSSKCFSESLGIRDNESRLYILSVCADWLAGSKPLLFIYVPPASVTQSDVRPTCAQEVAGSIAAESGNILSKGLIMIFFLRSFSPFHWFKKDSCQFLAKMCTTKPAREKWG